MKHLTKGKVRAFYDGELTEAARAQVAEHLATCTRCKEKAATVQARGDRVHALLDGLALASEGEIVRPRLARQEFETYLREKKERRMARNPFSKRYRPAWAALTLVLLIVLTMTVPPIRTLAGEFLSLFRVQQVEFVAFDPTVLPDEETLDVALPEFERMFDDNLTVEMEGERGFVDEATARARADFPIRLPGERAANRYEWTPPAQVALTVDLPRLRALFAELGYQEIKLPDSLDGETVSVAFQGMLEAEYGACGEDRLSPGGECLSFLQLPSPVLSAPDGLDVEQFGRIYLELLGMTEDEIDALSARIDWTSTLLVPYPRHPDLVYEEIRVDGTEGALVHPPSGASQYRDFLLTWIKDDIVYVVAGNGDHTEALALVETLP
jgi:hypothetical protein